MQDAQNKLHRFYDIWLSYHTRLATLLDNKNSTGVDLFIAEHHPHFDSYTFAIEHHTERCNILIHSPRSTSEDYTKLHNCLWGDLMTVTWLNFRDESCLPDTPTIYVNTPDPMNIENHKVTFADEQISNL